jgi:hypothetical protein
MTLTPFTPETLDGLALRLLDLAAMLRDMANTTRDHDVSGFQLHVNKVNEWLAHLENWGHDGQAKLETLLIKQRGAQRAQNLQSPTSGPRSAKRNKIRHR